MKGFLRTLALVLLMIVAILSYARRENSGWVAFMATPSGPPSVLLLMNGQGDLQWAITPDDVCPNSPSWSPDSEWIAFVDVCAASFILYRIRPNGGDMQVIANDLEFIQETHWAPNGEELLVFSGASELHVLPVEGGEAQLLDNDSYLPVWSPDGEWIYTVPIPSQTSGLDRIRARTGHIEPLLPPSAGFNGLTWSPDGAHIALSLAIEENLGNGVFIMEPDGGNLRMISEALTPATVSEPRWSPDGEWIAFVAGEGYPAHFVYRIRPDGSDLQRLTEYGSSILDLHWSPDSKWLIFQSNYGGLDDDIFRLRADGSSLESLSGYGFDYSPQVAPVSGLRWRPVWLIVAAVGMGLASLRRSSPK